MKLYRTIRHLTWLYAAWCMPAYASSARFVTSNYKQDKYQPHTIIAHWTRKAYYGDGQKVAHQALLGRTQIIKKHTLPFLADVQRSTNKLNRRSRLSPYASFTSDVGMRAIASTPSYMLVLGEADFSYTVAFLRKQLKKGIQFSTKSIIATELRSKSSLEYLYSKLSNNLYFLKKHGVDIRFGIDATQIHRKFSNKHIPKIYFNAPHVEGRDVYSGIIGEKIIIGLFQAARKLQHVGDRIYLAIPSPKWPYTANPQKKGTQAQFLAAVGYKLYAASQAAQYRYVQKRNFDASRYPGYQHRQTKRDKPAKVAQYLVQYIFEKRKKNEKIFYTKNDKEILYRKRITRSRKNRYDFYVLPTYDTDSDSSDYE